MLDINPLWNYDGFYAVFMIIYCEGMSGLNCRD